MSLFKTHLLVQSLERCQNAPKGRLACFIIRVVISDLDKISTCSYFALVTKC